MSDTADETVQPFFHPLRRAGELIGVSLSSCYRMTTAGRWKTRRYGTKILVPHSEVVRVAAEIEAGTFKPVSGEELRAKSKASA